MVEFSSLIISTFCSSFFSHIFEASSSAPNNLTKEDLSNNYVKAISPQDIFRQQDKKLINTNLSTFDIAYFPSERGQYNYNPDLFSSGLLKNPKSNYGAITRNISNDVDFDKTNIQYLEFWLMDPFIKGENGKILDGIFNKNIILMYHVR